MILKGTKKRVLKDVIKYYVETTNNVYEDFISKISAPNALASENELPYDVWLAQKCFDILKKNSISLADCIENKDVIHSAIKEDKSRMEGEFYTPEVWCKEGRKYLKEMLGDLWGKAYIWDASCGTGNLLKSADYPQDKIFMSTLLEEDVPMVQSLLPGATVFQCDFLQGIDVKGSILTDMAFSDKLPAKLREVLENNEPIVFYMNPPYKVMKTENNELGVFMGTKTVADYMNPGEKGATSLKKCALDIFHQFMFRMFLLKRDYNLTNMYMGIFGPITMFHSEMLEPLFRLYKNDFVFNGGMCFTAGDFSNTSESVGWVIGYTTWRTKNDPTEEDKPIVLTAKVADADGNVSVIGDRLITNIEECLHDWCKKDSIPVNSSSKPAPICTSIFNFAESNAFDYDEAIGYMMSSNYVIRATRRACITSIPNTDSIPIIPENFWKCVGSYAARRCYATKVDPFNNCQYYNQPNVNVEGYNEWLIDAVVLLLFDYNSMQCAYRNMTVNGILLNKANKLFPIKKEMLAEVIHDERILEDMNTHPAENQMICDILEQIVPKFSPEAKALYDWAITYLVNSLAGNKRKEFNYDCCLQAWDAGLAQLRICKGYFTEEDENQYSYLLSKLKDKLFNGIYKYGFMVDTVLGFKATDVNFDEAEREDES